MQINTWFYVFHCDYDICFTHFTKITTEHFRRHVNKAVTCKSDLVRQNYKKDQQTDLKFSLEAPFENKILTYL